MSTPAHLLEQEAQALHRLLFGHDAAAGLLERYVELHRQHFDSKPTALEVDVPGLLARSLDIEAVELALRLLRREPNSLSRKLHALCYLSEARGEYFDRFVARRTARGAAWLLVIAASLRSALKLAKGFYLVRRYDVV